MTGEDVYYRALQTKDRRFDGKFFTGVVTTGIFCRPVCPAVTPKRDNCRFFTSAAEAMREGYRPCLRCRPEAAPGSPAWNGVATTVTRALRLINDGALNDGSVEQLAERLGVTARHLRRLFDDYLGLSPLTVAQSQRLLFAKKLITETDIALNELAFSAGFGSVRRFNDAIRKLYGQTPSQLRRNRGQKKVSAGSGIELKLSFRPPYDWPQILGFLQYRAIPGVEDINRNTYRRSVRLGTASGLINVTADRKSQQLFVHFDFPDTLYLQQAVGKIRQLFDLDVDPGEVNQLFSRDPILADLVKKRPGLRVPGAWDIFELSVRAILGQQISVAAARTLAGRLVQKFGEPLSSNADSQISHLFPKAEDLLGKDLSVIGIPKKRAATIEKMAGIFALGNLALDQANSLDELEKRLCRLPGIGPWTAQYIAMRALREPDAFPEGDIALIRALQSLGYDCNAKFLQQLANRWRPFRAYAAVHLWAAKSGQND